MATLRIELHSPRQTSDIAKCDALPQYDDELDDVRSLLSDLCLLLDRWIGVEFLIAGFGQEKWPVSCARELSLLLEQLPGVARALTQSAAEFSIQFVEQGCMRILDFHRRDDVLVTSCRSGDEDWAPAPSEEIIAVKKLVRMLSNLVQSFLALVALACPEATSHPWFLEWKGSLNPLMTMPAQ